MIGAGGSKTLSTLCLSSSFSLTFSLLSTPKTFPLPHKVLTGFKLRPICSTTTTTANETLEPLKHSILLERLRLRHLKDSSKTTPQLKKVGGRIEVSSENEGSKKKTIVELDENFEVLGLSEEVMKSLEEMGISEPTEIQCIGIPSVLNGTSVVLGSHTGSGKTLAYMLPLVQLLREDEALHGMLIKPRRPRAIVLCPTRELCEQVFRVAKSISHYARFRCTMVSGGGRLRPQEDSLNAPIDMVVGTPGRVLQHIEDGNLVYGDIKYLVLDEADTMFDRGFGPDIRKFLAPLKNRASKSNDLGFQTVLVTATMTEAVQKLVNEEFEGIEHLRTSTLHKKISSARHDFIKLSGLENKLEALLQVLEPSLAKGNRVMVFCNTLNSSRAVDHFLSENEISTVNYHGEVPAEQRVQNLEKFKSDNEDSPTLVCTDLAARGLDLDVDHVIMFDFPKNSIDYLHRTGRTARMGAKGKVTSLVAKKEVPLATRIEEAMMKNESLECLSVDSIKRDNTNPTRVRTKNKVAVKSFSNREKPTLFTRKTSKRAVKSSTVKHKTDTSTYKPKKKTNSKTEGVTFTPKKTTRSSSSNKYKTETSSGRKISVVGFRGRSSLSNNGNMR